MKKRLDQLLVEKGLSTSREKAKRYILAGQVLVADQRITRPGTLLDTHVNIRLKKPIPFVSRGGLKLNYALENMNIPISHRVIADIGASTGGFTDCLLKRGASFVYAVDVGKHQLDYSLRKHPKVSSLEKLHAKNLKKELFHHTIDLIVADLSFISLSKVLEVFQTISQEILVLVKPQFEIGQNIPNFKGVVRNKEDHLKACQKVLYSADQLGLSFVDAIPSPIPGPKGNREFFLYWNNKVQVKAIPNLSKLVDKNQILEPFTNVLNDPFVICSIMALKYVF